MRRKIVLFKRSLFSFSKASCDRRRPTPTEGEKRKHESRERKRERRRRRQELLFSPFSFYAFSLFHSMCAQAPQKCTKTSDAQSSKPGDLRVRALALPAAVRARSLIGKAFNLSLSLVLSLSCSLSPFLFSSTFRCQLLPAFLFFCFLSPGK